METVFCYMATTPICRNQLRTNGEPSGQLFLLGPSHLFRIFLLNRKWRRVFRFDLLDLLRPPPRGSARGSAQLRLQLGRQLLRGERRLPDLSPLERFGAKFEDRGHVRGELAAARGRHFCEEGVGALFVPGRAQR